MIRHLKHHEIDKQQWDSALEGCHNRLIYASCWYLNIVSPGWEALVSANYEFIMPLPTKKKYGVPYLIQPKFTQQLGIFSAQPVTQRITSDFIKKIPRKFIWRNFYFNSMVEANNLPGFSTRVNYELSLNASYNSIKQRYNNNTARNISKAIKCGISVETNNNFCGFHELYRQHSKLKPNDAAIRQLQLIISECLKRNACTILLARNLKKEVIAGAFFLKTQQRIIYLCSFSTTEGYNSSALFLLMDSAIEKGCLANQTFDFEGSMHQGIARFFAGFGATQKNYYGYKFFIAARIGQLFKRV